MQFDYILIEAHMNVSVCVAIEMLMILIWLMHEFSFFWITFRLRYVVHIIRFGICIDCETIPTFQLNWLQSFEVRHAQFVLWFFYFFVCFAFMMCLFLYSFQCPFITTYATVFLISQSQRMIRNCLYAYSIYTFSSGYFPVILRQLQLLNIYECTWETLKNSDTLKVICMTRWNLREFCLCQF